jgi:hypothetical protein
MHTDAVLLACAVREVSPIVGQESRDEPLVQCTYKVVFSAAAGRGNATEQCPRRR